MSEAAPEGENKRFTFNVPGHPDTATDTATACAGYVDGLAHLGGQVNAVRPLLNDAWEGGAAERFTADLGECATQIAAFEKTLESTATQFEAKATAIDDARDKVLDLEIGAAAVAVGGVLTIALTIGFGAPEVAAEEVAADLAPGPAGAEDRARRCRQRDHPVAGRRVRAGRHQQRDPGGWLTRGVWRRGQPLARAASRESSR